MTKATLYLLLCILGTLLPLSAFLPWVLTNGLDFVLFFQLLFANPISTFFALDVMVAAVVVIVLVFNKQKAQPVAFAWLAIVSTLCVGVSCGLPLYLYLCERKISSPES